MNSNWNYPPPRSGWLGEFDKFIGPGADRAEFWLQLIPSLLAGALAAYYGVTQQTDWSAAKIIVSGLFAFDLTGGIITNATAPAKRWYHRAGQGFAQHFAFTAVHLLHLFLVAWLFRSMDWNFLLIASAYLLGAACIILLVPLYLQRPVAMLLLALSFLLNIYFLAPTVGLEWFLPFFYLKLLVSHLVHEEPYRP